MLESILISKSRSFPTDIGWTGEMNWASFFCTHQFLPRQWNTHWSAQHYSFAFMEFNHLHHYRKYYRFIDQMLTPEFLTTQGRKRFHKLKKEVRDILSWFEVSDLQFVRQNSSVSNCIFHQQEQTLVLKDWESTICNCFPWKMAKPAQQGFSAFNNSFREDDENIHIHWVKLEHLPSQLK